MSGQPKQASNTVKLPTYFLSHGGGPWSYMTGEYRQNFVKLESFLKQLPAQLPIIPKAILVVSAHWESHDFGVMASPFPPMIYDYSGFPAHTYNIHYRAPGSPELAQKTYDLIRAAGLEAHLDVERGFDHGTYTILAVTHPDANVPVIQVSIRADFDPKAHLQLGRALAPLREQGVLMIGSGLSYHNFRTRDPNEASKQFDHWLQQTLTASTAAERAEKLVAWEKAPSARSCHQIEDHLVPLFAVVGAAEFEEGACVHHEEDAFGSITVSSFQFG
jgi:aromatic ring-opening dioxygenase catalytic subunit (LigB family)